MHQLARAKTSQTAEQEVLARIRYALFVAAVGVLLLLNLTGLWKSFYGIDTAAVATLLAGYRVFYNSISSLLEKRITADLAICLAVVAALSAGEYLAAAEAMFIILVGEGLESYAASRTNAAIRGFIQQLPRRARVLRDGQEVEVDVDHLEPGEHVLVRAGERITADGVVISGFSTVDESAVTGESLPKVKQPGELVFSGTLNGTGLLKIEVTRAGQETTLAQVARLVEQAKQKRAPVERLADRYAKYFLPVLLLAAGATFYFTRDWLRTVAVLIVACPCALVLATPTAMVAAMGGLARRGILVRGGSVIQRCAKVDTVVFDKTGTITEGKFEIIRLVAMEGNEDNLLALAAAAERGSDHALARVIADAARRRSLNPPAVENARILPGRGAESVYQGKLLRAGSAAFLSEAQIPVPPSLMDLSDRLGATAVFVAEDNKLLGAILLRDRLRPGIQKAIHELEQKVGVSHIVMLTGDRRRAAEAIATELGIRQVEAELLPEQKLDRIRELARQGGTVAMAGDGINDAPALAAAEVGIAVSGAADLAAEAAGVVYMPHSLDKLPQLFLASRHAMQITWQNIVVFAGVVNLLGVTACATGKLGPLGAAFTHQLSSLLVMLNSLRLLRVGKGPGPSLRKKWFGWLDFHQLRHRLEHIELQQLPSRLWVQRQRWLRPVAGGALAFVALHGFYVIPTDEVGLLERFGRKLSPLRQPGLHYKLPWPIEKLTRVKALQARAIEIGYRVSQSPETEPAAYEWNVQHRSGRFQRKPEESLALTGDQNMVEVNVVAHYHLVRPDNYLYGLFDGEATVRAVVESALHGVLTTVSQDEVFTVGRRRIESLVLQQAQTRLDRYESGVEILQVRLLDVHPSTQVVDAFREVSGAFEEKNRLINEAEGYRNEQIALARGRAQARLLEAEGYRRKRSYEAEGDASRFVQFEAAFRGAPSITESRLYLETMEEVLPGRRKLIIDSSSGRRHLLLMEEGVEIGPGMAPVVVAPNRRPREEDE